MSKLPISGLQDEREVARSPVNISSEQNQQTITEQSVVIPLDLDDGTHVKPLKQLPREVADRLEDHEQEVSEPSSASLSKQDDSILPFEQPRQAELPSHTHEAGGDDAVKLPWSPPAHARTSSETLQEFEALDRNPVEKSYDLDAASSVASYLAIANVEIGPESLERNLRRSFKIFAQELRIEAGDQFEFYVSKFVEKKARHVARVIVQQYSPSLSSADRHSNKVALRENLADGESDSEGDKIDESSLNDSKLFREFLMKGEPLERLHARIEAFVAPKPPHHEKLLRIALNEEGNIISKDLNPNNRLNEEDSQSPPTERTLPGVLTRMMRILLVAVDVLEPPMRTDSVRLRWECACGVKLYEDFTELRPGGMAKLIERMQKSDARNIRTVVQNGANDGAKNVFRMPAWAQGMNKSARSFFRRSGPILPQSQNGNGTAAAGNNTTSGPDKLYMLTCMANSKYLRVLFQDGIDHISGDKDMFEFMRDTQVNRCHRRLGVNIPLRCVQGLFFVKFRLLSCGSAEIREHDPCCTNSSTRLCECIPQAQQVEPEPGAQYKCKPAGPPETSPPISSRQLMHWLTHPECIRKDETFVFDQLPKRKCGLLKADVGKPVDGWGLLYEENWNYRLFISILFALALSGSVIFAILWSCFEHDIQGAFGVSSYIIGTFGIFMMCVASQLDK
ncbi:hypothetical protein NX059_006613 [Plenodomus lindquistii]|nr:hypothetical protein NX059_006613 [Plenodomus lindquistii]